MHFSLFEDSRIKGFQMLSNTNCWWIYIYLYLESITWCVANIERASLCIIKSLISHDWFQKKICCWSLLFDKLRYLNIWYICRISRWICTSVSFGGTSVYRSTFVQVLKSWLLGQNTLIRYGFRTHSLSTKKLLIFIRQLLKINFCE